MKTESLIDMLARQAGPAPRAMAARRLPPAVAGGLVLAVASGFTIANVIRLSVYSREDEIEIMRLVGASKGFIRGPFLVEGSLSGALGGLLASGLLALVLKRVVEAMQDFGFDPGEHLPAQAPWLVTGDDDLLSVPVINGLKIVSPARAMRAWTPA